MGIFSAKKKYATVSRDKTIASEGATCALWDKCPSCGEIIYVDKKKENLNICTNCNHHFRMNADERINLLIDDGTFEEFGEELVSTDPLEFPGYKSKLEQAQIKTGLKDGVKYGQGKLAGIDLSIAVMDFDFIGGSMGAVIGEKITRAIELGVEKSIPVVVVSSSGGARMHEGIISLMQMAKTSVALERLRAKGIPFISIPASPTTGGVTASFAMLGDVIISEPKALICFAGPRVIEQTIKQKLPEGFQRAEFLLEHGMVDVISDRKDLKEILKKVLSNFGCK